MLASKTVLYGFAAILVFFTTYSVIPMERPSQQTSSNLEERVLALEEQVADLSARIAILEAQPITPTKTSVASNAPVVQVTDETQGEEAGQSLSADYQQVLSDVEPLGCEYDEFQDWDTCSRYSTPDINAPLSSWAILDGNLVIVESVLVQPTDAQAELRWAITLCRRRLAIYQECHLSLRRTTIRGSV